MGKKMTSTSFNQKIHIKLNNKLSFNIKYKWTFLKKHCRHQRMFWKPYGNCNHCVSYALTFSVTLLLFSGYRLAQAISLCIAKVNITSVWPPSSWNIHGYQSAKSIQVSDSMTGVADSQQIKIFETQRDALESPLPLQYFFLVTCHGVPGRLVPHAVGVSLSSSRRARAQMFYV